MTDNQRGLYEKYDVLRVDGSDDPGGKHEHCEYFVLDLSHDPYAFAAILTYARKCEDKYPQLAEDLRGRAAKMAVWMDERIGAKLQGGSMTDNQREEAKMEKGKTTARDLVYAAEARCPCGAGLAYVRDTRGGNYARSWDCSAILTGTAIPHGEPGAVKHTEELPFVFWKIKSETQPSAHGATTRPECP